MQYQQEQAFPRRAGLSRRSLAFAALFVATAIAAFFVDVDGLLHFYNVIGKASPITLETGAVLSALASVPFIAMGWSIGLDAEELSRSSECSARSPVNASPPH
jgi:nitric oxide reductase large subunit